MYTVHIRTKCNTSKAIKGEARTGCTVQSFRHDVPIHTICILNARSAHTENVYRTAVDVTWLSRINFAERYIATVILRKRGANV